VELPIQAVDPKRLSRLSGLWSLHDPCYVADISASSTSIPRPSDTPPLKMLPPNLKTILWPNSLTEAHPRSVAGFTIFSPTITPTRVSATKLGSTHRTTQMVTTQSNLSMTKSTAWQEAVAICLTLTILPSIHYSGSTMRCWTDALQCGKS
jgi:hypothetical protein